MNTILMFIHRTNLGKEKWSDNGHWSVVVLSGKPIILS